MCEGFRDVPNSHWIVLHPTLGIRYNSDATDKYAAAIIIELIGLRRWQWSEGNAVNARGASLILSYSDQGESKKYGWGGMVHVNDDVSVGLVRHKSDVANSSKTSLSTGYRVRQARVPGQRRGLPEALRQGILQVGSRSRAGPLGHLLRWGRRGRFDELLVLGRAVQRGGRGLACGDDLGYLVS